MNKLRIALLAGGDSSEREIALNSAHQIGEALDREKYDVKVIDLHHRSWAYTENGKRYEMDKNDFSLTVEGVRYEFDYAATDIRKEITEGKNFTAKVVPAVAKYIIQNKLYK